MQRPKRLSAPIYRLKRKARLLARAEGIPLHEALDRTAQGEGFNTWSLLLARSDTRRPARELLAALAPGDLLLLGARPGQGKTLLGLELIIEAVRSGRGGAFFTLEYSAADVAERIAELGEAAAQLDGRFTFDDSDGICAAHLIERLQQAPPDTVVVVDYLQLLDQKRAHPPLAEQIRALRGFARERGLVLVFISQIDRRFDPAAHECPTLDDVRLPNPLDLTLFSKTCFLHEGEMRISAAP